MGIVYNVGDVCLTLTWCLFDLDIMFSWMREMFHYADKNNDSVLSLKEVTSLLKYLNIEVDHEQARQIFEVKLVA